MNKNGLRWGLLVGGAIVLIKLLLYVTSKHSFNSNFLSCTVFIPYFFGMYMAAKDQRSDQGGYLTYWQGVRTAWFVVVLGTAVVTVFNYLLLYVIDPSLLEEMKDLMMTQFETMDMELPEGVSDMMENSFESIYKASLFFIFIISGVVFGFIGALIVASSVERTEDGYDDLSTL